MIKRAIILMSIILFVVACKEKVQSKVASNPEVNFETEKAAILETLNSETAAAFGRNYDAWQDKWVHDPEMSKIYLNYADSTFSESVGWTKISEFVQMYFIAHPEPDPIPEPIEKIEVRLYGTGAWVVYEQNDASQGRKRETRLMQKVDGQWKIASMQTTIYGIEE